MGIPFSKLLQTAVDGTVKLPLITNIESINTLVDQFFNGLFKNLAV